MLGRRSRHLRPRRRAELRGILERVAAAPGALERPLRWSVRISAPPGPSGDVWGDLFFAEDLVRALRQRGQDAYVDRWEERIRPDSAPDDITLDLIGLHHPPVRQDTLSLIWVISHPDRVSDDMLRGYDRAFAASRTWSALRTLSSRVPVLPLLQATDPARFHPRTADPKLAADVLFVGKTRNVARPAVLWAAQANADLAVYGEGWREWIDPSLVRAEFLVNDRVPAAYASARIVLNDHWPDMAAQGFVSNRLFDAAATGARVLSDEVFGLDSLFGGLVRTFRDQEGLAAALRGGSWPDDAERRRLADRVGRHHSFGRRADLLHDAVARLAARR